MSSWSKTFRHGKEASILKLQYIRHITQSTLSVPNLQRVRRFHMLEPVLHCTVLALLLLQKRIAHRESLKSVDLNLHPNMDDMFRYLH